LGATGQANTHIVNTFKYEKVATLTIVVVLFVVLVGLAASGVRTLLR
jgi:hypothetical protein